MRIDVHTHIFPPAIVSQRDGFFSGEPTFELLYGSPKSRLATAEDLIVAMDEAGVDASVAFGFPWQNGVTAALHNDYVLEAAARYPHRLIPMGCVDPLEAYAPTEARRCMAAGAAGLGELAVYGSADPDRALSCMRDLVDITRDHRGVLLVHANEPVGHQYPGKAPLGLEFFYSLAKMTEDIPLILAHWGGGLCFYEMLKREAKEVLSNVYYDTAASPFLYQPAIYSVMCDITGPQKILMGSDFPLLKPGRYDDEMAASGIGKEDRDAICGLNAAPIFQSRLAPVHSP